MRTWLLWLVAVLVAGSLVVVPVFLVVGSTFLQFDIADGRDVPIGPAGQSSASFVPSNDWSVVDNPKDVPSHATTVGNGESTLSLWRATHGTTAEAIAAEFFPIEAVDGNYFSLGFAANQTIRLGISDQPALTFSGSFGGTTIVGVSRGEVPPDSDELAVAVNDAMAMWGTVRNQG